MAFEELFNRRKTPPGDVPERIGPERNPTGAEIRNQTAEIAPLVAEAVASSMEISGSIRDAVIGYKAYMMQGGFSETAAEMMAVRYHHALLAQFIPGGDTTEIG